MIAPAAPHFARRSRLPAGAGTAAAFV